MNRKNLFAIVLTQSLLVAFGFLSRANGQENSIIKVLPEAPKRISSRLFFQDPVTSDPPRLNEPTRPDQQSSPSDEIQPIKALEFESQNSADNRAISEPEQRAQRSQTEMGPWPRKGLRGISIDIRENNANAPEDRTAQLLNSSTARWSEFSPTPKVFAWAAPDIRYQPLYFEDVALERYGQTSGLRRQPVLSGFHFYKSLFLLPHQMMHDAPTSCDGPLGFCRPGDDVPFTIQRQYFGDWRR